MKMRHLNPKFIWNPLLLLMLAGCTSMQLWFGWKIDLRKIPVASISATLSSASGLSPGHKEHLIVSVAQPDGKVFKTEGSNGGKVLWRDLHIVTSIVTIDKNGVVSLANDPRLSDGQMGHIIVTAPSHPELRAELDIPVRYDAQFRVDFSGRDGTTGMDGMNGSDGFTGSMGSIVPTNPSPGGKGGDGSNGMDGENGGSGDDAPPVQVRIALRNQATPLLQVEVSARNQHKYFLVNPDGGSLTVLANGGAAGMGGHGGHGGRGGAGGAGTPAGSSGMNGMDGHDGLNGFPGKGGLITVTYDPGVSPYLKVLHLFADRGPKPVFIKAHVDALW